MPLGGGWRLTIGGSFAGAGCSVEIPEEIPAAGEAQAVNRHPFRQFRCKLKQEVEARRVIGAGDGLRQDQGQGGGRVKPFPSSSRSIHRVPSAVPLHSTCPSCRGWRF